MKDERRVYGYVSRSPADRTLTRLPRLSWGTLAEVCPTALVFPVAAILRSHLKDDVDVEYLNENMLVSLF